MADPTVAAKRAIRDKRRLLGWWTAKYGSVRVADFDVLKVRQARDRLSDSKRGAATVNRCLNEMRSAWNWGRTTKHVQAEHAWPQRLMLLEPKGRVRFLADSELAALWKVGESEP